MTRIWIGLAALFAIIAIDPAPGSAQGKSGKNGKKIIAVLGQEQDQDQDQGGSRDVGLGNAKSGVPGGILSGGTNLPPGLAKKGQLPPGLAKMDSLPPGLAKDRAVPPGLAKKTILPPGLRKKDK